MRSFTLPLSLEDRKSLKVGEHILLSGILYTARDAAHKRLFESNFEINEKLETVYYVGPTATPPSRVIGSSGPTTATRMDKYTPFMIKNGTNTFIGKGRRSKEVIDALVNNNAVYLIAIGGLGALLSDKIISNEVVYYEDLKTEAIRKLVVKDFPVVVGIDTYGGNIYE